MNQRHVIPAVALLSALVVAGALAGPAAVTTATAQEANASITYDDQRATDTVTVESAALPEGGFVVVYNESGSHVGNSSYLDAGTHENVTVEVSPAFARDSVSVAEVHRDNGSDESFEVGADGAYTRRGAAVADTSFVTTGDSSTPTATGADGTETPATTAADGTESSTETAGADGTAAAGTTETGTPGFTAVVAVVALAGAALLAVRR